MCSSDLRLNVLVNTFGKNPRELFDEFEGKKKVELGSGDVKYHQGFSSNVMTTGGEVHLAMAFNPSHLEIVSPVVEGSVRARQDRRNDSTGEKVLPISIHGDAAFAGQGVVLETFQMSQTRGFKTGGTVHIVINNQVGFTISNPLDARSTEYATDVAKMIQAPILHVNGDDPEAVLFVTQLAVDYRMQFKRDVVIDLVCYRRRGHNEADEPSGTQPLMYQQITKQRTTRELYAESLIKAGIVDDARVQAKIDEYRNALDNGLHVVKSLVKEPNKELFVDWRPYLGHTWTARHDTSFDLKTLQELSAKLLEIPDGFVVQRQVAKIYEDRQKMQAGGLPINWGYAETMAYATLAFEGHPIRMTGQDIGRGTFSHRHAVLHNQKDAGTYIPLQNLYEGQPRFDLYDSFLSEEAVLAFEYGYSTTTPNALVIWEAQFGDFANGAQVVIDQFISSGERKWLRMSGLVCLLPHGYEGQGPEHSSARLERFLQLCAEDNMQVANVTTPANYFHILRRQVKRDFRKPLILMTPKSLLRHKRAVSSLSEMAGESSFHRLLWDDAEVIKDGPIKLQKDNKIRRVVMCTGKVYYDLLEEREKRGIDDVYLLRIEQLYPFPAKALINELSRFRNAEMVWCQEEPKNMGAWSFIDPYLEWVLAHIDAKYQRVRYTGRPAAASPATGLMSKHLAQLEAFLEDALGG